MGASIFKKLKTNCLAAGASIYINEKENENEKILKGWGTNEKEFENFYENKIDNFNINDIEILKIKSLSNHLIKDQIKNTQYLKELHFKANIILKIHFCIISLQQ